MLRSRNSRLLPTIESKNLAATMILLIEHYFPFLAVWPQDGPPHLGVPLVWVRDPPGRRPLRPLALLPPEGDLRHGRHGLLHGRLRPHHGVHHAQVITVQSVWEVNRSKGHFGCKDNFGLSKSESALLP